MKYFNWFIALTLYKHSYNNSGKLSSLKDVKIYDTLFITQKHHNLCELACSSMLNNFHGKSFYSMNNSPCKFSEGINYLNVG